MIRLFECRLKSLVVVGGSRESMHDFRSFVDMMSREHVEFEEKRMHCELQGWSLAEIQKEEEEGWRAVD